MICLASRLKEVVDLLEYEELLKVKNDLNKGGNGVRILIDNRLKEETKKRNEFCAVCASKIDSSSETRFSMTIGPEDFERKVSFCAMDCLQYFLEEMKKRD